MEEDQLESQQRAETPPSSGSHGTFGTALARNTQQKGLRKFSPGKRTHYKASTGWEVFPPSPQLSRPTVSYSTGQFMEP